MFFNSLFLFFFFNLYCSNNIYEIRSLNWFSFGKEFSDKPAFFWFLITFLFFFFFFCKFLFSFLNNFFLSKSKLVKFNFYDLFTNYFVVENQIIVNINKIKTIENDIRKYFFILKIENRIKLFNNIFFSKEISLKNNLETKEFISNYIFEFKNNVKIELLELSLKIAKEKAIKLLASSKNINNNLILSNINEFKSISSL